MAIVVPKAGDIVDATTFGAPIANEVNRLTPIVDNLNTGGVNGYGLFGWFNATLTSNVDIPWSLNWQRGGWANASRFTVPTGADGIYAWTFYAACAGTPSANPSYLLVAIEGINYYQGWGQGGAGQISGISSLVAGGTIQAQANIGPPQNVTAYLRLIRLGKA